MKDPKKEPYKKGNSQNFKMQRPNWPFKKQLSYWYQAQNSMQKPKQA
jgi:hypothetical protein